MEIKMSDRDIIAGLKNILTQTLRAYNDELEKGCEEIQIIIYQRAYEQSEAQARISELTGELASREISYHAGREELEARLREAETKLTERDSMEKTADGEKQNLLETMKLLAEQKEEAEKNHQVEAGNYNRDLGHLRNERELMVIAYNDKLKQREEVYTKLLRQYRAAIEENQDLADGIDGYSSAADKLNSQLALTNELNNMLDEMSEELGLKSDLAERKTEIAENKSKVAERKTRKYQELTVLGLTAATVLAAFLVGNIYKSNLYNNEVYPSVPLAVTSSPLSPLSRLTALEMHAASNSPWCEPETRVEFTQYLRGLCPELPEGRTPRYLQFNGGEVLIRADNCETAAATIDRIVFPECQSEEGN